MRYNLKSVEDIQTIQNAILNNEEIELGDIAPIHYKLKLIGGRFDNYDPRYIDMFVAKIILDQQNNYDKLLKEIEKVFHVTIAPQAKLLKFELQHGSLELLADLMGFMEVFDKMESIHQLYAVLGIAGGWFTYAGFNKFMENTKLQIQEKSQEKLKELDGQNQQRYLDIINKTVQSLETIALNTTIQNSINKPKQELATMLEDDEALIINDNQSQTISRKSKSTYDYVAPIIDDIEEEIEDTYTISNYYFRSEEKYFKLEGISIEANSLTITPQKRIAMITKAENLQAVKLKLKIIRDGLSKKIKQVYILDYFER